MLSGNLNLVAAVVEVVVVVVVEVEVEVVELVLVQELEPVLLLQLCSLYTHRV